jgi:hypothetical protein
MATSRSKATKSFGSTDTTTAVDEFMLRLQHPHKAAVESLREVICGADSAIREGVKWNSPSFRTTEYFATTHLRAKTGIAIILHLGAKVRDVASVPIEDPERLLAWLAKDRAMVSLASVEEVRLRKPALQAIVRQWISFV